MSDLFEKINKGSILLWNVEDEKELPKRKEMIRLLGTEEFTYYKSHGHHREHVKTLARLKSCLDNSIPEKHRGFWSYIPTSHFLFTEKEIESNSFFALKYSTVCHGSYFVNASDLADLDQLNLKLYQVQNIVSEVKSWPEKIKSHQNQINKDGINDRVIENFDVSTLISISERYGDQAIEHALSNLRAWHEQHFWKSKKAKQSIDISQGDAVTA